MIEVVCDGLGDCVELLKVIFPVGDEGGRVCKARLHMVVSLGDKQSQSVPQEQHRQSR